MKIVFTVSKRRKGSTKSHFNATLSDYWQQQYNDMFRRWKNDNSQNDNGSGRERNKLSHAVHEIEEGVGC